MVASLPYARSKYRRAERRGKRGCTATVGPFRWWKCIRTIECIVSTSYSSSFLSPTLPSRVRTCTHTPIHSHRSGPRTIPHTGHWGHITLPTYIQSLLIYIYYSLAPLFIVFRGERRERRTGETLICSNWKLWSATMRVEGRNRRMLGRRDHLSRLRLN